LEPYFLSLAFAGFGLHCNSASVRNSFQLFVLGGEIKTNKFNLASASLFDLALRGI
jgi:hypothetical protein